MADPMKIRATAKDGGADVRVLMAHEMETGQRKDAQGKTIPRKIIKGFSAKFNGKEIFRSDWHPSVSANPYLAFLVRVPQAGTFEFSWFDDDGSVYKSEHKVAIG